jgi:hypothetical protein
MGLGRRLRPGLLHEPADHQSGQHAIERAGPRLQCAAGFRRDGFLDGVAVQDAAGQGEQDVILEIAQRFGRRVDHPFTLGSGQEQP